MRQFTTAYIKEKNKLEGAGPWAHLVELVINVNTTAYFTTHPETHVWNNQTYMPVPMQISGEEQSSDGSLARMFVDVANPGGLAFKFAKDNNLKLNDVTIRTVNLNLTSSGDDARVKLQIIGAAFNSEAGRFHLGFGFNFDAEGPLKTYNRRDHPSIPFNLRNYAIIG